MSVFLPKHNHKAAQMLLNFTSGQTRALQRPNGRADRITAKSRFDYRLQCQSSGSVPRPPLLPICMRRCARRRPPHAIRPAAIAAHSHTMCFHCLATSSPHPRENAHVKITTLDGRCPSCLPADQTQFFSPNALSLSLSRNNVQAISESDLSITRRRLPSHNALLRVSCGIHHTSANVQIALTVRERARVERDYSSIGGVRVSRSEAHQARLD